MHSQAENIFATHKNYYQVMGVATSATAHEISKSFKKLALKWHPDLHQEYQKSFANRKFIDIVEAYEVLGNPSRRNKYDVYRRHQRVARTRRYSGYSKPAPTGMKQQAPARSTTDAAFEFTHKFEKELHKWSKKAGKHAQNLAKKSYTQFALSLEIVNKLVIQGIFHTIDLFSGKVHTNKTLNEHRKHLEETPDDPVTHYRMGFLYHQNGDYEKAAHHYLDSLRINPKDADVFCNLGRLREDQGKQERAISCYERAVKLNPDLYVVYAYLGIIHLKMQHYLEAKKCLDYLIETGQKDLAKQIERSAL